MSITTPTASGPAGSANASGTASSALSSSSFTAGDITTVEIENLPYLVARALKFDDVLIVLSKPGSGKSSIINAVTKQNQMSVVEFRGAQHDPTKLSGLDVPETLVSGSSGSVSGGAKPTADSLRMLPSQPFLITQLWSAYNLEMDKLRADPENQNPDGSPLDDHILAAKHPGVLCFFDEFTAAAMSTQSGMLEYVLDRSGAGYPMPPKTRVILAGNRPEDKSGIRAVNQALINRGSVVTLSEPEAASWIRAMNKQTTELYDHTLATGLHPLIQTYLTQSPQSLNGAGNNSSAGGGAGSNLSSFAKVSASPRQWSAVNELFLNIERSIIVDTPNITHTDAKQAFISELREVQPLVAGKIGQVTSYELTMLSDVFELTTPAKDILRDPSQAKMPKDNLLATLLSAQASSGSDSSTLANPDMLNSDTVTMSSEDNIRLAKAELMQNTVLARSVCDIWTRPRDIIDDEQAVEVIKATLIFADRMPSANRQVLLTMLEDGTAFGVNTNINLSAQQARAQRRATHRAALTPIRVSTIREYGTYAIQKGASANAHTQDLGSMINKTRQNNDENTMISGGDEV